MHWLGGILLGWNTMYYLGRVGGPQPVFLVLWLTVFFVSILVHELGHAFMARLFGYRSDVTLVFFGGFARHETPANYSHGREVLITLAGPGAGFLLAFATLALTLFLPSGAEITDNTLAAHSIDFTLSQLLFVNIFWSIFNLIPVLPLDGGRICDVICRVLSPSRGPIISRWIGVVISASLAVLAFRFFQGSMLLVFMLMMFAFWNYQDLQQRQ